MKLSSAIRAARLVAAPCQPVWRAFSRTVAGPCELPGGLHAPCGVPSQPGEEFPLLLRRRRFTLRGRARLAAWQPGELAAWQGRIRGISFGQALILNPQGAHCLAESHLTFSGWSLIPARVLFPAGPGVRAVSLWLRDLAAAAESRDQDQG